MKHEKIKKLTVSAVLLALSTVLSMIKVWQMPLGGSVTLLSMLPICLISVLFGVGYSIAPCLLYGIVQMFLDNPFGWGLTQQILIGSIVFDYILAFGVLCFAGIFRKKGTLGITAGVTISCGLRFLSHALSGVVFFSNLEQFQLFGETFANRPVLYSVCYNGFYMLPELILTVVGAVLLKKSGAMNRMIGLTEHE